MNPQRCIFSAGEAATLYVTVLHNRKSFEALAFNWKAVLDSDQTETLRAEWQLANILHQNNPLLKLYYTYWDNRAYEGELPQSY